MKNREKYRDEILNSMFRGDDKAYCEFARKNVLPNLTDCTNGECGELRSCWLCRCIFDFWLDEEYEEPPKPEADWSNVPVDTLVRVRNSEDDKWLLRYFHLYCEDAVALKYNRKYKTFDRGATSKTCMYPDESWRYCELAEDEYNGSN